MVSRLQRIDVVKERLNPVDEEGENESWMDYYLKACNSILEGNPPNNLREINRRYRGLSTEQHREIAEKLGISAQMINSLLKRGNGGYTRF